jgi:hypothetical protein
MALSTLAYLGPGGVLSTIGSLLALAGAVVLGLFGFVWYPMKRWLRARKARQERDTEEASV